VASIIFPSHHSTVLLVLLFTSITLEKCDVPDKLEKYLDPNGNGGADPNHKGRFYTWGNNDEG